MRHTEPEWYEALRSEPFRSRAFKPEWTAGVLSRVAKLSAEGGGWRRRRAGLSVAVAVTACAASALLVWPTGDGSRGAVGVQVEPLPIAEVRSLPVSHVVPPVWAGDRPSLPVRVPNDSQWQELIEQTYPAQQTSMLHKEALGEERMLIFSRRTHKAEGYLAASLYVDEFVWGSDGWKGQARVGYSPSENLLEAEDAGLLTGWSGISLDPQDSERFVTMFYGVVADPAITDIRVTDGDANVYAAGIHDAGDGYPYWFAALPPGEKGSYTVEGLAADGGQVYAETFYYR